ncbi:MULTISPECIES: arginase family protein [Actinoalloteichus]|uniref:Arginase n=1 Tax=Actinoalloteichus caeruleus DSM 43889 TaxID=1120930 RepID=A0ABT1JE89_ACTCY|nr:arginase family protein [Actinoalloteichus caeruleus]MCP2330817.1 arginase [Actinoalloteichus caeruleus DSM 43889]
MAGRVRTIAVLDAPSNLGLRPPEDGVVPGCGKAPGVLRDAGLVTALDAVDAGVVTPGRYRPDWTPGTVRNEAAIAEHSLRLAARLDRIADRGELPLVLGGDCSILVGIGAHLRGRGRFGLVSFDGLDYRHPGNSDAVGAAGGESLALTTGRGGMLAELGGTRPYVRPADTVALGVRPDDEYLADAVDAGLRVITSTGVAADPVGAAEEALRTVDGPELAGFWVHVDADVLDPDVMPAVDSPEAGGLTFDQLVAALGHLAVSPRLVGVDVTIYDPDREPDPDFRHGRLLADLLVSALAEAGRAPAER